MQINCMHCFLHLNISQVTLRTLSHTRTHTYTWLTHVLVRVQSVLLTLAHCLPALPSLPNLTLAMLSLLTSLSLSHAFAKSTKSCMLQNTHAYKCLHVRVYVCVSLCASTSIHAAYSLSRFHTHNGCWLSLVLNLFWRSLCACILAVSSRLDDDPDPHFLVVPCVCVCVSVSVSLALYTCACV